MDPREDFQRISVNSIQDWEQFRTNYRTAAIASLEERILTSGLGSERDALLTCINEFVDRTFRLAEPNLRINGQNYESLNQSEQNMEPFDEALDRRIWSLAATRLQWQKRVSETRRKLPLEIEAMILELLEEQKTAEVEEAASLQEDIGFDQVEEDTEPLVRYPQIGDGIQAASALGEELDQTIPTQCERAQRIREVAVEVEILKS